MNKEHAEEDGISGAMGYSTNVDTVQRMNKTNNNFLPFVKSLFDLATSIFIFALSTGVRH